jgi:hypothetical protein
MSGCSSDLSKALWITFNHGPEELIEKKIDMAQIMIFSWLRMGNPCFT